MVTYFHITSQCICKSFWKAFFFHWWPKWKKKFCPFPFLSFTCSLSLLKVKVWFQNRRMKWKRVKGGQQGAAAREKELVNVKKGTLLPSELSGIGAATLQQTGDSLANEDSHDSDHSSEHAHLWYRQRGPAPFSGKKCGDGKPYSNIVYTEKGLWPWFLILLSSGIPSLFFMIYRGFTLSATYERCFHREDGGEYSRGVGRVYDSEQPLCLLLLALKIKLLSRANYEAFVLKVPPEWRCRRWIGFEHCRCPRSWVWQWAGICSRLHWQLHYYSRINHEPFLSQTATVPEIILKWVKKMYFNSVYITLKSFSCLHYV